MGTPRLQNGWFAEVPKSPWRPLAAPRLDFHCFFGAPVRHQKSMIFRLGPKSTQGVTQSTPGRSTLDFGSIFMTFGVPFWLRFSIFSKNRKTMKSMTLTTFWKVFHLAKPLIFRWNFHNFSCFFRNPSRRAFLEVQSAGLSSKGRFWCHFRFSGNPKISSVKM